MAEKGIEPWLRNVSPLAAAVAVPLAQTPRPVF